MRKDITKKFLRKCNADDTLSGWWYKKYLFDLRRGMKSKDKGLTKTKQEIDLLFNPKIEFTCLTNINKKNIARSKTLEFLNTRDKGVIEIRQNWKMINIDMIYCDGGYFEMGSAGGHALNAKRIEYIDKPFWLSNVKITKGWYERVMGYSSYRYDEQNQCFKFRKCVLDRHQPMCNLTWYDTILFCNSLSEMLGLETYYEMTNIVYYSSYVDNGIYVTTPSIVYANVEEKKNANGFRLPYEKEWEYAAKAGTSYEYFGTNDWYYSLKDYAWFGKNSNQKMHDVATKKPNAWGFYDMFGLVYEWCYEPFDFSTTGLVDGIHDIYSPSSKEYFKKNLGEYISNLNRYGTIQDKEDNFSKNYEELFKNFRVSRGGDYRSNHMTHDRITNRHILGINPYDVEKIKKENRKTSQDSTIRSNVGFRIARNVDTF